ncbi:RrF2 family transcriptional regulator [Paenibacillus eucommiae]|uniref:Rrf2 family protein n=1 Tax=Paenibacillus eucommiae TaxID=1355755 RepID=A0ABS4IR93_9BACL|nr:Rrf2 family transcriptional regulator [Paenibacillus eucommiae]MBP1990094.1 Rrf2 family protein [Paenibacillus eucommiae]
MSASNRNQQIGPPKFSIAVHALVWLAKSGDSLLSSSNIACQVNSHATFLRRVLALLANAGIVEAREGRDGGYTLRLKAEEITLADVYVAVKSDAADTGDKLDCGAEAGDGDGAEILDQALLDIMDEADQKVTESLKQYTIAYLLGKMNQETE